MRKPYIISYDLSEKNQDKYDEIFETIQSFGAYCKFQKSVWLVKTDLSPEQMYQKIISAIGSKDYIFICELNNSYYGYGKEDNWDFVKEHIF